MKPLTATDKLVEDLVEKHRRRCGHMGALTQGTAIANYRAGLVDALEWVRKFNEEQREKTNEALNEL